MVIQKFFQRYFLLFIYLINIFSIERINKTSRANFSLPAPEVGARRALPLTKISSETVFGSDRSQKLYRPLPFLGAVGTNIYGRTTITLMPDYNSIIVRLQWYFHFLEERK
jgi:hypothetical protein